MTDLTGYVCKWCGETPTWSRLLDSTFCAHCRTDDIKEREPAVGDTILTSGGELPIVKASLGLATVMRDGLKLDYFLRELTWSETHAAWIIL